MRVWLKRIALGFGALLLLLVALLGTLKLIWAFGDAPPESATGRREVALARAQAAVSR